MAKFGCGPLLLLLLGFAFIFVGEAQRTPTLVQRLPVPGGAKGPECLAFDITGGGPYTGISDGRVIKWDAVQKRWINFATTSPNRIGCEGFHDHVQTEARCGRPLGLSFNYKTGQLYIADAYKGLLVVGPNGGLATPVATQARGIPFRFVNDVAVDQSTGMVYFTDSSSRFQRKEYQSLYSGDNTGRLMRFDPRTNNVTVLAGGLRFPNGVALSRNGDFVLVTETASGVILRHWLSSRRTDLFARLPGNPDNIRRNSRGEFWVAMNPRPGNPNYRGLGMAARLSQSGTILEVVQDVYGATWRRASHFAEALESLWVGSVEESAVVRLRL